VDLSNASALVTGGASGLGLGTVKRLIANGVPTVIVDLPTAPGDEVAAQLGHLATFAPADVTDADQFNAALNIAERVAPLRAVVHCAGRAITLRVLDRDGNPGDIDAYRAVIETNLVGTFNVLRLTAARMVRYEPVGEERGVVVLTASIAAWEGQIGQIPYASSKAGIVGMTLVAARDLSRKLLRVNTIAPGIFDTPGLGRHSQAIKDGLAAQVPHPARLGVPDEFGHLALALIENPMVNGETVRLDGAVRMSAK
jgi:NAD(P)-dependent dehydrogenase (short-subunit alcohol dehydrogenase family)